MSTTSLASRRPLNHLVNPIRPENSRVIRKHSVSSQRSDAVEPSEEQRERSHDDDGEVQSSNQTPQRTRTTTYAERLQERLLAAREAQDAWFDGIAREVDRLELRNQEIIRISLQEREQEVERRRQEQQRIDELRRITYQARLVEATEKRRVDFLREEAERRRRAAEAQRRREEAERRRIEVEAWEQRRLEVEAAAAAERRRAEAERRRIEAEETERARREAEEAERRREEAERRRIEAAEAERTRREAEEAERARREAEAAAERARREAEAAAEAERRRRERERECVVCMDRHDMDLMVRLPCQHWYCHEDLANAFQTAYDSRIALRCCGQEVPVTLVPANHLAPDFHSRYELLLLELTTPNPIYCSNRSCGLFIPPQHFRGPDEARCGRCGRSTCRHCGNASHAGYDCPQDLATQQAIELGQRQGWKRCPRCRMLVERPSGCNHMTCRCGQHFCYVCGAQWRTCGHR